MAEIDLIPTDYRQYLQLKLITRCFVALFSIMLLSAIASRVWAEHLIKKERATIETLKINESFIIDQTKHLENLKKQRSYLKACQEALDSLLGGPSAERMFVILSRAINPSAWITDCKFLRDGKATGYTPAHVKKGSFQVTPKNTDGNKPLRGAIRMEIRGQALNHSALAGFVKKLLEEPMINDVQILKTVAHRGKSGHVIEYNLAVAIM